MYQFLYKSEFVNSIRTYNVEKSINLQSIVKPNEIIILGFETTDTGEMSPIEIINDVQNEVFIILNKEYAALNQKLKWCQKIRPKMVFTVCHRTNEFENITNIPFYRISWSCDSSIFMKIDDNYKYDLFFSGIIRKEQTENLRYKILQKLELLNDYKIYFNYGLMVNSIKTKHLKKMSDKDYNHKMQSSKISFVTTGPADLVGTRFFEISATNKSMILCNRMSSDVYNEMFIDKYNCIMFDNEEDFIEKFKYYIENNEERLQIVHNAYDYFISNLTWDKCIYNMLEQIQR